jgi:hypothetical protein
VTWTKLDDNIYDNPKMVKAGEEAADLYVRALVYCNKHLTDGRIEAEVLGAITRKRNSAKLAAELVRVGAWEMHPDGGWTVHDFHDHNPTAEEVIAKRAELSAKRSEAGKLGGMRSGERRSNEAKLKQAASEVSKQTASNGEAIEVEATKQTSSNRRTPVPSRPVPSPSQSTPDGVLPPQPPGGGAPAVEPDPPKRKAAKVDAAPAALGTPAAAIARAIASTPLAGLVLRPNALAAAALDAFPAVDLPAEVARAGGWCVSNPKKAPRADGDRFLWAWLQRAQDRAANTAAAQSQRAGGTGGAPAPDADPWVTAAAKKGVVL